MRAERRCGVLCHPTSLPGRYGIGDLGDAAYRFVDYLALAGQSVWQVLPLGPTGFGDSPYQPFSAFAGNHLLISPDRLVEDGLLTSEDLADADFSPDAVSYGEVIDYKGRILRRAYDRYMRQEPPTLRHEQEQFETANQGWLDDYALFMALKLHYQWAVWTEWERPIALREPGAPQEWAARLEDAVSYQRFLQFLFERQWQALKSYANAAGVTIMGDMPIFVGHDSADVWAHRELFYLDEAGKPTVIAGVPPDYFSPTGQRWGNPLYRWDVMRADGYVWWIERLNRTLATVDEVRLDHFRGFAGYWEVPATEETAIHGRWVKGPGADFLDVVQRSLGGLPIVAEDLGLISVDVDHLRDAYDLPGMRVLQFAFGGEATNVHLPHNYPRNCVVYTGTHDNDTTRGWYATLDPAAQHRVRVYTGTDGSNVHWALLCLAYSSVADTAIAPLQDLLGLGSEARLNLPGRPSGNWTWRFRSEMLSEGLATALRQMALISGRWRDPEADAVPEPPLELKYEVP